MNQLRGSAVSVEKQRLRVLAQAARRGQPDKDRLSRLIIDRVLQLPAYQSANTVLWYLDVRAEVRTRPTLPSVLASGQRIAVPWCNDGGQLELFHLESLCELATGRFGILEPKLAVRSRSDKRVEPNDLDFVLVPGVAFDRRGGRLGHGQGYYDRLLKHVRPDATLVGLAFDCQILEEIPLEPHDILLHQVVTEKERLTTC